MAREQGPGSASSIPHTDSEHYLKAITARHSVVEMTTARTQTGSLDDEHHNFQRYLSDYQKRRQEQEGPQDVTDRGNSNRRIVGYPDPRWRAGPAQNLPPSPISNLTAVPTSEVSIDGSTMTMTTPLDRLKTVTNDLIRSEETFRRVTRERDDLRTLLRAFETDPGMVEQALEVFLKREHTREASRS